MSAVVKTKDELKIMKKKLTGESITMNFREVIFLFLIISSAVLSGCTSSESTKEETENKADTKEENTDNNFNSNSSESKQKTLENRIIRIAGEEQKNPMYMRLQDSTYLYWINNQLLLTENSTKCNIFAMNVLFKAGCKCPEENVLTYDLMDTNRFREILPLVEIKYDTDFRKGDLIIWSGHVIIFDSVAYVNDELYAFAYWAGTSQENNGKNIINDVVFGKYRLDGDYIVRRPVGKMPEN